MGCGCSKKKDDFQEKIQTKQNQPVIASPSQKIEVIDINVQKELDRVKIEIEARAKKFTPSVMDILPQSLPVYPVAPDKDAPFTPVRPQFNRNNQKPRPRWLSRPVATSTRTPTSKVIQRSQSDKTSIILTRAEKIRRKMEEQKSFQNNLKK